MRSKKCPQWRPDLSRPCPGIMRQTGLKIEVDHAKIRPHTCVSSLTAPKKIQRGLWKCAECGHTTGD